ncbi:MAG: SAM-dependent chlorinase/fluorinase [Actinobacteria bacterium]|nr:SAM-dependent chlorinase/fluorinase [Actinomycetota bacterium]MCL5882979.1 SAM-dependent chlorinase/fluorinase [Actinomycetota bacterium]
MTEQKFITFLSDFGLADDFVGTCHGVIKRITPEADIIDITHGVPRHDVMQGAVILCNALPYLPKSVVLAVVDPGVGGHRKPLALRAADGTLMVGPDNGLLSLAARELGGVETAVELTCSIYSLPEVCKTFEGRDLFAPAAAHLAGGVPLEKLGAAVPAGGLETFHLPKPVFGERTVSATVIYTDRFGNVQLNLSLEELKQTGAAVGDTLEVRCGDEKWKVPFVQSFADVDPENLLVYEDSYRKISFSVNQGNAARVFQITPGNQIILRTMA